jgi:hypothetical protein
MARAQLGSGHPDKAIEAAGHAPDSHWIIGEAKLALKNLQEAEAEYSAILEANPRSGPAYLRRGEIGRILGRPQWKADLRKARELLPALRPYINLLLDDPPVDK